MNKCGYKRRAWDIVNLYENCFQFACNFNGYKMLLDFHKNFIVFKAVQWSIGIDLFVKAT